MDPGSSGMPDDARPLTEKGIKRMHQIASGLAALDLELDAIVTSPLLRARETAEIVADALGALRSARDVERACRPALTPRRSSAGCAIGPKTRLMLVGHNPTLSELVSLLVVGARRSPICELKKGGIAALSTHARGLGLFELSWVATAAALRQMGGAGGRLSGSMRCSSSQVLPIVLTGGRAA